jgi:hypothetical protein
MERRMQQTQQASPTAAFDDVADASDVGPFVLDLCAMPGPIAIPQPRSEALSRFSFFCSRRPENGGEGYWLCMGYFGTRAEAQKWLEVMRRVYPAAWITQAEVTFAPATALE